MDIPPRLRIGILAAAIAIVAAGLFGFRHVSTPAGTNASQEAAPAEDGFAAAALVVDVQRILDESEAAKGVQKQLNAERVRFQSETEKEENQLRQAEQDLGKQHAHLGNDAYSEREQQLRQHFVDVERHVEKRRRLLDQSFTDAMNQVRDRLLQIVQAVAKEKGANLALVKQQILWSGKTLDVTDEILSRLNKELPQVTVKPPDENKDSEDK